MAGLKAFLPGFGTDRRPDPVRTRRLRPRQTEGVIVRPLENGSVELDLPAKPTRGPKWWPGSRPMDITHRKFELEELGAFVWSRCDGRTGLDAIARALVARYKMPRVEAEAALGAFVQTLSRRGLLVLDEVTKP